MVGADRLYYDDAGRQGIFDVLIERLLIGLLVFMPLTMGARNEFCREAVVAVSGAIAVCFLLKLVFRSKEIFVWSWAYVPVFCFLLIVVVQLFELPAGMMKLLSPETLSVKQELLSDLPAGAGVSESTTISFYSYATRGDLRILLALASVFIVVVNVYREPRQIKRLLGAIALIGGVVACIAMAQKLFGNGKIYWRIEPPHTSFVGPFVNHSHYGQFANLSIGAALGWLLVKLHEDFSGRRINPPAVLDYLACRRSREVWVFVGIIIIGAASVFLALTRGGMISMLVAGGVTLLMLCRHKSLRERSWIMVFMAIGAFVCILAVGFNAVYERFATLGVMDSYQNRLQILKDLGAVYTRFPLFGTGLGTHVVVYPMFQKLNSTLLFTHAENEYAQVLEEAGIAGFLFLFIFGIIIFITYIRNVRSEQGAIGSATYGLGFGIAAILVHSLSDFGQHVPANAFLTVIFCGLLLVISRMGRENKSGARIVPAGGMRFVRVFVFLAVSVVFGYALKDADGVRRGEEHWKQVVLIENRLLENEWKGTKKQYDDLTVAASAAVEAQPENMKYRYYQSVYQWYSMSRAVDNEFRQTDASGDEEYLSSVRQIRDELNEIRVVCPTYGPAYSMAGQIEKFILNEEEGADKIRKGYLLAPCDPVACFVAGRLDVLEGDIDKAVVKFGKAVDLDSSFFKEVVNIYVMELSRPELAIEAAGEDVSRLVFVTEVLEEMLYEDLAESTREKTQKLLEEECTNGDVTPVELATLAEIYDEQGRHSEAIEHYGRALGLKYSNVYWRLELAKLLAESGRVDEAMKHAKICLRIRPQFKQAEELLEELSVLPGPVSRED